MKEKGLGIVAVNRGDSEQVILKYVGDNKFSFPIVMGGSGENYTVGKAYGVRAYPTNYLIDPAGRVLYRSVGFNEKALREAIARAGIQ